MMLLTLEQLVEKISPARTTLFFGAGASIPSGAPSVSQLVSRMAQHYDQEASNMSLMELATYIEIRTRNRKALIDHIRASFSGKQPTGGLLTVPNFEWRAIYTTNYDTLVEQAYAKRERSLKRYLSNFDFDGDDSGTAQKLFKLHGSIDTDRSDGHNASLVLTESDYHDATQYREFLYNRLQVDVAESMLLVIGYSLSDPEIRNLIGKISELKAGANNGGGCVFLMYERDLPRAELLIAKNFDVAFGGIDDLFGKLILKSPRTGSGPAITDNPLSRAPALIPVTIDVAHACANIVANPGAMFNGHPASFADIANRLTFDRDIVAEIRRVQSETRPITVVLGASGTGKTTAARQALLRYMKEDTWFAWEHNGDHVLLSHYWVAIASWLKETGRTGVLLVDDAHQHLQHVNELIESLTASGKSSLRLLLVSSRSTWSPRVKSPMVFKAGAELRMQRLSSLEIEKLLNLVDAEPRIRALVENSFAGFSRQERKRRLLDRCDSETFVCLKNVFASDGFDAIILREFAELTHDAQAVYRQVAFLETSGVRVHRQLLIRLLGISPVSIRALLAQLEDVVTEYTIDSREGIYGWRGRHSVITGIVTRYKFSDQEEIQRAMGAVIDCINPAFPIEVRSLRELCNIETGVSRIADLTQQNILLRRMISVAPSERVPRHRLIRNLINMGEFDQAATEIRIFSNDLRKDGPAARYEIELTIARATRTPGLMLEDRRAMLSDALALAQSAASRFPSNKGVLKAYCELGVETFRITGNATVLDAAIDCLKRAEEDLGDPDLTRLVAKYERRIASPEVSEDAESIMADD